LLRCCRGIGTATGSSIALLDRPDDGGPAYAITISRVAELLGEDEELLWELTTNMEPEDGCLWIHGTGGQETIALTSRGMEVLQELLADYKAEQDPPRS
jgi:hypothetical protein